MTERMLLIAGMALVVYAVRLSGFALARRGGLDLPRELRHMPVVVLAALVAVTARGTAGTGGLRALALVAAGVICWQTRRTWAGLLAGVAVFWLLRWAAGR